MFNSCPTRNRRGSRRGLAAIKALILTPYLRAITEGVSPVFTVCVWAAVGEERDGAMPLAFADKMSRVNCGAAGFALAGVATGGAPELSVGGLVKA